MESPAYPVQFADRRALVPGARTGHGRVDHLDSGGRAGTAIALPVTTAVIAWLGWRGSFVAAGMLGLAFSMLWLKFYRDVDEHPRLGEAERAYIRDGATATAGQDGPPAMPWLQLLRYRTVWGMVLGFFCLSFVLYFITWFPSYLVDERGFDLLSNSASSACFRRWLAIPAQWFGGWLQKWLLVRGPLQTVRAKFPPSSRASCCPPGSSSPATSRTRTPRWPCSPCPSAHCASPRRVCGPCPPTWR
ncbi:MFS transporter [Streptomyces thinghirensis]|nr:MFS transporter [Streptomyces thinghirensis]